MAAVAVLMGLDPPHRHCSSRTNAVVGLGCVQGEGDVEGAVSGEEGERRPGGGGRRRRQEQPARSQVGRRPFDLQDPDLPSSSCEEEDHQYHHPQ